MREVLEIDYRIAEEELRYAQTLNEPAYLLKPKLSIDGDQWCALFGENLMEGVAGFGNSPAEAYNNFNNAWYEELKR